MKEIIFVTHNKHKLEEVCTIVSNSIAIKDLSDLKFYDEIEETASTLEGNALLKAKTIFDKFQQSCFADDTGLEIEALNNRPGVYSARYAGEPTDSKRNMEKVLKEMQGIKNRNARFRTVIAFISQDGQTYFFEGVINGHIAENPIGKSGFGYDPIFIPNGYNKTFAELTSEEKNKISHRRKAIDKFTKFLFNII